MGATTANSKSNGGEIAPPIPSGFGRMKYPILGGFAFLTIVYQFVIVTFPMWQSILSLPDPADEFCPDGISGCPRPDLFAFEVASGQALLFCGVVGFFTWHVSRAPHTQLPATPEGRLFGHLPEACWVSFAPFLRCAGFSRHSRQR